MNQVIYSFPYQMSAFCFVQHSVWGEFYSRLFFLPGVTRTYYGLVFTSGLKMKLCIFVLLTLSEVSNTDFSSCSGCFSPWDFLMQVLSDIWVLARFCVIFTNILWIFNIIFSSQTHCVITKLIGRWMSARVDHSWYFCAANNLGENSLHLESIS